MNSLDLNFKRFREILRIVCEIFHCLLLVINSHFAINALQMTPYDHGIWVALIIHAYNKMLFEIKRTTGYLKVPRSAKMKWVNGCKTGNSGAYTGKQRVNWPRYLRDAKRIPNAGQWRHQRVRCRLLYWCLIKRQHGEQLWSGFQPAGRNPPVTQ